MNPNGRENRMSNLILSSLLIFAIGDLFKPLTTNVKGFTMFGVDSVQYQMGIDSLMTENESELWKKDSVACLHFRANFYYKILGKNKIYRGTSRELVDRYLGCPNYNIDVNGEVRYFYFIESGPHCLPNYIVNSYDSLDIKVLFFFFNKEDKVYNCGVMVP